MATGYDHASIEEAARKKWAELKLYEADLSDTTKEPYYLLIEFPYPSGDLHIGHWYAYAIADMYARILRMRGKNVLFPIGFDAFGLPAENAAIRNGVDPSAWTMANIERMRKQINSTGASFDWSKEIIACDPSYYHWTQWLFSKLFEHGLAEHREAPVKWCPKDQTVLANEQVIDGCCERCGSTVEEKVLTQWFLKITAYAERLLTDLENLPWREEIKDAQRAWIGKSEGAELTFSLAGRSETVTVFTTRPDTVYGATYLVLAPEHPLVATLLPSLANADAVEAYVRATKQKTERERSENKEKTGVRLEGVLAVNPATKEEIPVYIADYALATYGTGAVMAVPAHDERDFEFAQKYELPIRQVVRPRCLDERNPPREGKKEVERNNTLSIVYDPKQDKYLCLRWKGQGWTTFVTGGIDEGEEAVASALREIQEETGYRQVRFVADLGRTRSDFFAAHKDENRVANNTVLLFELEGDERDAVAAEEKEKHEGVWLTAKEVEEANPQHAEFHIFWPCVLARGARAYTGPGTLINSGSFDGRENTEAAKDIVTASGGTPVTRYRIRDWLVSRQRYWGCPIPIVYDPSGKPHPVPSEHLPWLLPTDVDFRPTGEAPLASSKELKERVTRIFGEGWTPEYDTLDTFVDSSWYFLRYLDSKNENAFSDTALMKKWLPVDRYSGGAEHTTMHLLYSRFFHKALYDLSLVPTPEPYHERFNRGIILGPDGLKMSKSKGNVINPDDFVEKYGSDAVRLYLAFIGPYSEPGSYPWQLEGVPSMRKFLERVARIAGRSVEGEVPEELQRKLAFTGAKVRDDADRFKFNTAIAALMTLLNSLEEMKSVPRAAAKDLVRMLAPFAPHLMEHLWSTLGGEGSVHSEPWPEYDAALLEHTTTTVVVQVEGKRRGSITLAPDAPESEALALACALPAVSAALGGKQPSRTVYVPGRIINLVP